jgi:hypothetical protein
MRLHQTAEISEMSQTVLAPQQPPQLLPELMHSRVNAGLETLQVSAARAKFRVSQNARK